MDDSALEHSVDDTVASDASSIMLDGELGAPKLQEATFHSSSTGEQENKQLGDEPDLSLLPDELGTQEEPSFDQNDAGGNGSLNMTQDSGIFTDYNTQNSTSADVPGDSVQGAEPGAGTVASPSCHMTPMTPTIHTTGSGIIPQLQNIVSTVNLGCSLDLKMISLHARNAEYNPKRFGAVIMRIREPRTTALIFHSGKVVCLGAKSEEQSRLAARKYARLVQKLGFPARFLDFKIRNMVASCDVCFPIRLEGLILAHQQFASYEPELFPGLIYRMVRPRVVLLIFVSGKVVITGAKTRGEIYEALENIYPILKGLRKEFKSSTED